MRGLLKKSENLTTEKSVTLMHALNVYNARN